MIAETATVFIVDDDPAVRESLSILLAAAGHETVSYGSGQTFLEDYDPTDNGCLLLDVQMQGMSGLELQQRLKEMNIRIPTIIITAHGNISTAVKAMKYGAFDFLEKPYRETEILEKIRDAMVSLGHAGGDSCTMSEFRARYTALTGREQEVFGEMIKGLANKNIARALGISHRTVEIHRSHVLQKMGVKNLPELVRLAVRYDMA